MSMRFSCCVWVAEPTWQYCHDSCPQYGVALGVSETLPRCTAVVHAGMAAISVGGCGWGLAWVVGSSRGAWGCGCFLVPWPRQKEPSVGGCVLGTFRPCPMRSGERVRPLFRADVPVTVPEHISLFSRTRAACSRLTVPGHSPGPEPLSWAPRNLLGTPRIYQAHSHKLAVPPPPPRNQQSHHWILATPPPTASLPKLTGSSREVPGSQTVNKRAHPVKIQHYSSSSPFVLVFFLFFFVVA